MVAAVRFGVPATSVRGSSGPARPWTVARAPLLAFMLVYIVTCLVGALLMVVGYREFVRLFEYFSGTPVPRLSDRQTALDLILLLGAPLYVCLGYSLGLKVASAYIPGARRICKTLAHARLDTPQWLPVVAFCVLAVIGMTSIVRAGSLRGLSSWFDYQRWVDARALTFRRMTFFEFVNIYLFVPVSAAWVVVTVKRRGIGGVVIRWSPLVVTLGMDVLLFQKKTAVVSFLIVLFAWILSRGRQNSGATIKRVVATLIGVSLIYTATVIAPVYSRSASTVCGVSGINCHSLAAKIPAVVDYSVLSPITRTSAPALYYPVIYPNKHAFYTPDFGQDIVGIGRFPDDNLVVWHYLNPHIPGSTAVPFQFTLYSQGGLIVALLGSLIVGLMLALAWRFALSHALPPAWSSLVGALVMLFAVYVAIDSLRNSITVSYGVAWGLFFIACAAGAVHVVNHPGWRRRKPAHDEERVAAAELSGKPVQI
jgi:hypothetical protein